MHRLPILSLASAALLCACPGSSSAPDSGLPASADAATAPDGGLVRSSSLGDLCAPIAAWECTRAASCGCKHPSGSALEDAWCRQVREAACVKELQSGIFGLEQGLSQGSVSVRVDRVSDCVAAYEVGSPPCTKSALVFTARCMDTLELTAVKSGGSCPWPGVPCGDGTQCTSGGCAAPVADGGACQENGQCASRHCVAGKCAPLGTAGAACAGREQCAPPLVCLGHQCTALAAEGAACTDAGGCVPPLACVGGRCAQVTSCASGEVCGHEGRCVGPVSSACQAVGPAGASCKLDRQCAAGMACDLGAWKCAPLPGNGEACLNGVACSDGFGCVDGQGTCSALGGSGSPCLLGPEGPVLCASGAVCSDSGTCIADPKEGEPCGIPNACGGMDADQDGLTDLVCAFGPSGSTCVKRQGEGAPCEKDTCAAGLFCHFVQCRRTYAPGEACTQDECGAGQTCRPDEFQVLRCQDLPALGEPCFLDCESGTWCERTMANPTCQPPICVAMYQLQ